MLLFLFKTLDLEISSILWAMIRVKPYRAVLESWQKYLLVLLMSHSEQKK